MKFQPVIIVLISILIFSSCEKSKLNKQESLVNEGWMIDPDRLIVNENSHDRIPSIDSPVFVQADEVSLNPNEEVLVYQTENQIRIYPINSIWSHEIINDRDENNFFCVTYCPITGSGIAWNRFLEGHETTFGVSGHLYNNNMVPYDRKTESYWSQMKLNGIKGPYGGYELEPGFMLHTIYSTAIAGYPDAVILYDSTYSHTCDSICLPPLLSTQVAPPILSNYFGVVIRDAALLFNIKQFGEEIRIISTNFKGKLLVVAGSSELSFSLAFLNPEGLTFQSVNGNLPDIMKDNEGNTYDLMGNISSGPKKGQRLDSPFSYSAKEFAWKLFFGQIEYYQN